MTEEPLRERRTFWCVHEHRVVKADGYAAPDGYWWLPSIGYSVPGSHLFATEAEARKKLLEELRLERTQLDRLIQEAEAALDMPEVRG